MNKDKVRGAVDITVSILRDTESGCGCNYGTTAGDAIAKLVDLAQKYLNGEIGEGTADKIADTLASSQT